MRINFFLIVVSLVIPSYVLANDIVDKLAKILDEDVTDDKFDEREVDFGVEIPDDLDQLDRDNRQETVVLDKKPALPILPPFCCVRDCCTAGILSFSLDSQKPSKSGFLPGVSLSQRPATVEGLPNGHAYLKVTFDKASRCPTCRFCLREAQCHRTMLKIIVELSQKRSGWLINIGDSATNDGYGGDGNTQNNDAEFQLVNDDIRMYKSDVCRSTYTPSTNFISPDSTHMVLHVSNNRVLVEEFPGGNRKEFCENCLFALNGQPDPASGGVNQDIYIAFHRVVRYRHDRTGQGIRSVHMSWECPVRGV